MMKSTVNVLFRLGEMPSVPRSDVFDVAVDEMFAIADTNGSGTAAGHERTGDDGVSRFVGAIVTCWSVGE